jgi:hypothetical protein
MSSAATSAYHPSSPFSPCAIVPDLNLNRAPMSASSARNPFITEREIRQIERANAIHRQPVIFIPGRLPGSWDRWVGAFEAAGYAALTPSWPNGFRTTPEASQAAVEISGEILARIADHFAGVAARLDRRPAVVSYSLGSLIALTLAGWGLSSATVAMDSAPSGDSALVVLSLRSAATEHGWREVAETALEFVRRHAPRDADLIVRRLGASDGSSAGSRCQRTRLRTSAPASPGLARG